MALLSNQWLRTEFRVRESGHMPVSVSLTRDHEPYAWKRANDIAAVFRLAQADRKYELLALHEQDVDLMLSELSTLASKSAKKAAAISVLKGLGEKEFVEVLAEALKEAPDAAG